MWKCKITIKRKSDIPIPFAVRLLAHWHPLGLLHSFLVLLWHFFVWYKMNEISSLKLFDYPRDSNEQWCHHVLYKNVLIVYGELHSKCTSFALSHAHTNSVDWYINLNNWNFELFEVVSGSSIRDQWWKTFLFSYACAHIPLDPQRWWTKQVNYKKAQYCRWLNTKKE